MIPQLILMILLTITPTVGFAPINLNAKVQFNRSEVKVGEDLCVVVQGPLLNQGIIGEFPLPVYFHRACMEITPLSTGWWEVSSKGVPGGVYQAWVEVWVKKKIRLKTNPITMNYVINCDLPSDRGGDPRCL